MECQKCGSTRLIEVKGKTSDLCSITVYPDSKDSTDFEWNYVPDDMGIGGGDYIEFTFCLNCGQIQGEFPLETTEYEGEVEE